MGEWPKDYHPARPDADGDGLEVDTVVTVQGWQVQPGTWDDVTLWCRGVQVWSPRGVALGSLDAHRIALLGDWVMDTGFEGGFEVSRADGHFQRWQPATT